MASAPVGAGRIHSAFGKKGNSFKIKLQGWTARGRAFQSEMSRTGEIDRIIALSFCGCKLVYG